MAAPSKYSEETFRAANRLRREGKTWKQIGDLLLVPRHFETCFRGWKRRMAKSKNRSVGPAGSQADSNEVGYVTRSDRPKAAGALQGARE